MTNAEMAIKLHNVAEGIHLRAYELATLPETASKETLLGKLNELHEKLTRLLDSETFGL